MTSTDLLALLAARGGVLPRAVARSRGITQAELSREVAAGALRRVRHGLYAAADVWDAAPPWVRFLRTVEAVLQGHPRWVASHHAALALHGLPLHGVDLDRVDVAAPVGTSKVRGGLHVHRLASAQHHLLTATPRALPVPDACVLTALSSGTEAGVVAMDAALHRGLCTRGDLTASLAHPRARYRSDRARAALAAADGLSESPGETRTRLLLGELGLDIRSQVDVHDASGLVGRVDLLVEGRVVVEFDGAVKYAGDTGRDELVREKRREDRLRAAGYLVVRVTWADLERPAVLLARVRAALALAA